MLNTWDIAVKLIIHATDGYSVNVDGALPDSGYMVGGYVRSLVLSSDAYLIPRTQYWLRRHNDTLLREGMYAGVWTDSETRDIYVDLSRNVDDLYTAMAIALAHGELAIWDVANNREIRTDIPAEALRESLTVV